MTSLTPPIAATSPASHRAWLFRIILVGIILRILGLWLLAGRFSFPDAEDYDSLARAIALNLEYQVNGMAASRMPGYPAFVSNFYVLFGIHWMPVLLTQAFISGVTGLLVYVLGREFSPRTGRIAAALFAIDPLTIGFAATLLSETVFTTLLLLMLWLAMRVARHGRLEEWLALGLVATVATYVRAEAYWLIFPLGVAMLIATGVRTRHAHKKERLTAWGIATTGFITAFIMVVSFLHPWQSRNAFLFPNTGIHLTSLEGISLYESVYPQATGGPMQDQIPLPKDMIPMSEGERDAAWREKAWNEISSHPWHVIQLIPIKIARTWSPWMNASEAQNPFLQIALTLWHVTLYMFAILGIRSLFQTPRDTAAAPQSKEWGRCAILFAPVVYFTAVHALYLGSVRYRVPLMPILHIFAAAGVSWAWNRWQYQKYSQRDAAERV